MKIRERCENKPSKAIQFMLDGLKKQSKRSDFGIHMDTFGSRGKSNPEFCYGCAATCAIQELAGIDLNPSNIFCRETRSNALGLDDDEFELERFEVAIDDARVGFLDTLLILFGLPVTRGYNERIYLEDDNWESQIPGIEQLISDLERDGY